jgi:hypothetical protein
MGHALTAERANHIAQGAYLKASNTGIGDLFGYSVALSGDTLAVTAVWENGGSSGINGPQDNDDVLHSGAVYVFHREHGSWAQEAYIKASNPGAEDEFGRSMALDGDTLVVGAPNESSAASGVNGDQGDDSMFASGAAYVFRRVGGSWSQEAYLKASNPDAGDRFGWFVNVVDDLAVVGAPHEASAAIGINGDQRNNDAPDSGAAYAFCRTRGGWVQEAYIKATNTHPGSGLGWNMALSDKLLALGAPGESGGSTGVNGDQRELDAPQSGAVYVLQHCGNSWSHVDYIKASNTYPVSGFGWTVALSGRTLVVGAPGEWSSSHGVGGAQGDFSAPFSGAVYVFRGGAGAWEQEAFIKASNAESFDQFGGKVVVSNNRLTVTAVGEDSGSGGINGDQSDNSAGESGAVYLFTRGDQGWQQAAYTKPVYPGPLYAFGYGVAMQGNDLLIGAPQEDGSSTGVNGDQRAVNTESSGAVYELRWPGAAASCDRAARCEGGGR